MRLVLAVTLFATPCFAQDFDSMQRASELSTVLASEQLCGLNYDQQAIQTWISDNVAPDDLQFATMLSTLTMGTEMQLASMTGSQKTAHCAAITMTARHYGFVD